MASGETSGPDLGLMLYRRAARRLSRREFTPIKFF
jgi:hypothetical protein